MQETTPAPQKAPPPPAESKVEATHAGFRVWEVWGFGGLAFAGGFRVWGGRGGGGLRVKGGLGYLGLGFQLGTAQVPQAEEGFRV